MNVEREYKSRVDAMSVAERVGRAEALFDWSREYLARSILAAAGSLSERDLKWEIALRAYGGDPAVRSWLEELRTRVTP